MMDATTKEIAALLRSTEQMASQFIERVQARAGQPVSQVEILAAMRKISSKSLSMEKVVAKVQQQRKSPSRRATRRPTARQTVRSTSQPESKADAVAAVPAAAVARKEPGTILDRLGSVIQENWDRAEAEGLQPNRMSAEAFVNAIHQYTDRREGTRRRILQAAQKLNQDDVMLTPALVADVVHQLFES
jgi:hypothetical protein